MMEMLITTADLAILWRTTWMSLVALVIVTPFAVWLAYRNVRNPSGWLTCLDILGTLPLALPPVATGIFMLELFSRYGPLGEAMAVFGITLPFNWKAVVLALSVMSFPLVYRPVRGTFQQLDKRYIALSESLGHSPLSTFFRVTLPLARHGILAGFVLGWARALGEFGATIILAGDIPGETRTLSLAIFHRFQMGNDMAALRLAFLTAVITVVLIYVSYRLEKVKS